MYGLPTDFDPSVFIGRVLERVSFTSNMVKLSFDGDVSIVVESELRHEGRDDAGTEWADTNSIPLSESRLMQLLDVRVAGAHVEGRGTLVLNFNNGQVLRCIEESEDYECYQLRIGATEIIV